MKRLFLQIRTPQGMLLDQQVTAIVAEDLDGFVGIWPGRTDLVVSMPAGLLSYRDGQGEGFIALSGGLLNLRGEQCRVMVRDASVTRDLEDTAPLLESAFEARAKRAQARIGVLDDLEREALRRAAREVRA